jgi:hypothetical protein
MGNSKFGVRRYREPHSHPGRAAEPTDAASHTLAAACPSRPTPPETQSRWCRLRSARATGPHAKPPQPRRVRPAPAGGPQPPNTYPDQEPAGQRRAHPAMCCPRRYTTLSKCTSSGVTSTAKCQPGRQFRARNVSHTDIRDGARLSGPQEHPGGDLSPLGGHNRVTEVIGRPATSPSRAGRRGPGSTSRTRSARSAPPADAEDHGHLLVKPAPGMRTPAQPHDDDDGEQLRMGSGG